MDAIGLPKLVFNDTQVVVVEKPAGIESCPFEDKRDRSKKNKKSNKSGPLTLLELTQNLIRFKGLKVVHRLDKDTSGLLVFAKNRDAEHSLAQQFRFGKTHRRYLALVHGHINDQMIETILMPDRGDGLRGSTTLGERHPKVRELGKFAVTHLRVKEQGMAQAKPWSLIECELETGRTHQIRIHLSELGHPLIGEELYLKALGGGFYVNNPIAAPRQMLHAHELGIYHPIKNHPMSWKSPLPPDFLAVCSQIKTNS